MTHWRAIACAIVAIALAAHGVALAQRAPIPPPRPAEAAAKSSAPIAPLSPPANAGPPAREVFAARLAALQPRRPLEYLLLAEEVADVATTDADRQLARELFALAFALQELAGTALPPDAPPRAAALLGLASLASSESQRWWLRAMAASLDARYAAPERDEAQAAAISAPVALRAAEVLGLARAGDGREARRRLDLPGVRDLLRRYERLIGATGRAGALARLEQAMAAGPCPQCSNERLVVRPSERGVQPRLCPTCGGNPGPSISTGELVAQLRFESALLSAAPRSWAAQLVLDQGAPLRDPDAAEVPALFGVDPAKPYWRAGAWSATP